MHVSIKLTNATHMLRSTTTVDFMAELESDSQRKYWKAYRWINASLLCQVMSFMLKKVLHKVIFYFDKITKYLIILDNEVHDHSTRLLADKSTLCSIMVSLPTDKKYSTNHTSPTFHKFLLKTLHIFAITLHTH